MAHEAIFSAVTVFTPVFTLGVIVDQARDDLGPAQFELSGQAVQHSDMALRQPYVDVDAVALFFEWHRLRLRFCLDVYCVVGLVSIQHFGDRVLGRVELESSLEERCVQMVERLGGLAIKLQIPGVRGFPDRTIMLGRHIWFAEFKRIKTGRVSSQQKRWAERLAKAGFATYFIDNEAEFEKTLEREVNHAQEI